MLAADLKSATFSWVFGRRMHKRRRSTWRIHSWSMPTSWVRETWSAFLKTRGQMSSPCPPLQPGRLPQSCTLSTKVGNTTAPCIRWWRMVWNLALRMMRPQWYLWVLPRACSSSSTWTHSVQGSFWHLWLHRQQPVYLCVFSQLVFPWGQ